MTDRKIRIIPFDMKYLEDYYNNFNDEITKYQWPDPFESIEDARAILQDFLDEMEKEETLVFAVVDTGDKFVGTQLQNEMQFCIPKCNFVIQQLNICKRNAVFVTEILFFVSEMQLL